MEEKPDYQFSITVSGEILEIIITGNVTRAAIDQLNSDLFIALNEEKFEALLFDVGAAKSQGDSLAAVYFRVRNLPENILKVPSAIVYSKEDKSYISFYETTATNVGVSVKWFTDIEAARTWLKSKL